MSDYTGPLDNVVSYREGYKYATDRKRAYQTKIRPPEDIVTRHAVLHTCGVLEIFEGCPWNGANVVRDRDTNMRASLIHDVLVDMIQAGLLDKKYKIEVDEEYYEVCREDDMWLVTAITEFFGIQYNPWENSPSGRVLYAPKKRGPSTETVREPLGPDPIE